MSKTLLISTDELEETIISISEKIITTLEKNHMENINTPELMTTSQVAKYLQCSTQSVKNWTDRDDDKNPLIAVKAGADPRYFKVDIDNWLKQGREISKKTKK